MTTHDTTATPEAPTFARPRKPREHVPGRIVVRFRRDAISPAAVRVAGAGRKEALEALPRSVGEPLDYLRTNAGLRSVEPVSPTNLRLDLGSRPERDRLAAVASVAGSESDLGTGLAVLDLPVGNVTPAVLKTINASPAIEIAEPLPARWLAATPDPKVNLQWALAAIRFFNAKRPRAAKVKVGIVDTGIDESHPDLPKAVLYQRNGYKERDLVGHGTHVAGIIGALTNNAVGISGIADCQLAVWKVFPDDPNDPYLDSIAYLRALNEVVIERVAVVNLSLAGIAHSQIEADLFAQAIAAGVTFVAAMGNEYNDGDPTSYPAAYADVISVGALNEARGRSSFSNTGKHIDLAAPGSNILSTLPTYTSKQRPAEKDYAPWSGTSMATPHVTAAAALIKTKHPNWRPAQIAAKLAKTAVPVPEMRGKGWTEAHGKACSTLRLPYPESPMRLQLKFKPDASSEARAVILNSLASQGAGPAVALFPDSRDKNLEALYVVDAQDASVPTLVDRLNAEDAVEVAEPEIKRRLAAN
jgi:subtilisin family serine protease